MNTEKKCVHCELMDICKMHQALCDMAEMLNTHMKKSIAEKSGFANMVDNMAHDCRMFTRLKDE